MTAESVLQFDPADFIPSLAEAVKTSGLDERKLHAPCPEGKADAAAPAIPREVVIISDTVKITQWDAPPLHTLFRGDKLPPADISHYPPEYVPVFSFIEMHVPTMCDVHGDKTDGEFKDWYSNLRRRPDGRSLGEFHDHLWRVLALLLAMRPTSPMEYEAVVGQLALSAAHFRMGPSSRNYIDHMREMFD